jgi:hypothetical protein
MRKGLFTTLLEGEGREFLDECLAATFEHCRSHEISTVVMYTANGFGAERAVEMYLSQPEYQNMRLVAVTPPANKPYIADPLAPPATENNVVQTGIFGDRRKRLHDAKVPIVSARLPFRSPISPTSATGTFTPVDPLQLVDRAFGVLGGGFSLCLQAVMMACDAGLVASGDLVAAMSADTAIVAYAAQTETFLSAKRGLLALHIICKPGVYTISKYEHEYTLMPDALEPEGAASTPTPPQLAAGESSEQSTAPEPAEPSALGSNET